MLVMSPHQRRMGGPGRKHPYPPVVLLPAGGTDEDHIPFIPDRRRVVTWPGWCPTATVDRMDTPEAIRERAGALVEYLLAVRALLERPVRTGPATDAFWQADRPGHPAVAIGPGVTTGPWLPAAA